MTRTFTPKRIYIDDDQNYEGHGAALLLLVREGIARDWKTLCRAFGWDWREFHSGHLELRGTIEDLVGAHLLESGNDLTGPYRISDPAFAVIHALGISLTHAANMPYFGGVGAHPFFGKPKRLDKAPHVFVLMPFSTDLRSVYEGPIKRACRGLRLSVERADDIFSTSEVVNDIWTAIFNCGALIADCTGRNPNVFYEIGVAHTLGKPVVLISQRDEDVPFDINYIRYSKYDTSAAGLRKLEGALRRTLREVGKGVWLPNKTVEADAKGTRGSAAQR